MEELPQAQEKVKPFDIEDELMSQAVEQVTPMNPPAEDITVESPLETQAEMAETAPAAEDEKPDKTVRKRRVSSGIKRKTVAPRKSTTAVLKRTRKKASPPSEEGNAV
jgi:hypothetical protein